MLCALRSARPLTESSCRVLSSCVHPRFFTNASKASVIEPYTPHKFHRPMSPFTHYAPQVSSVLSISHRVSGVALTGLVYGGSLAYLFFSTGFSSLALAFASLPVFIKFLVKLGWVAPNLYHFANGIRHLDWDTRISLSLPEVYNTANTVVIFTGTLTFLWLVSRLFAKEPKKPVHH